MQRPTLKFQSQQPYINILDPYEMNRSIWARRNPETHNYYYSSPSIDNQSLGTFMSEVVFNSYNSTIRFGRFSGLTIKQIFDLDKSYLEFCIRELRAFYLTPDVIKDMLECGYVFSGTTTHRYKQKLSDYSTGLWLKRLLDAHEDDEDEADSYSESRSRGSCYNDELDMDQQGQEFWDSL